MLFSNNDLYKGEWLDLVFKNRNHNYGAYTLRQENDNLMIKAVTGTFLAFALFGITATVIARSKPLIPTTKTTIIETKIPDDVVYEMKQPKELPKPKTVDQPAQQPKQVNTPSVQTQVFVTPKPVPDDKAEVIEALKEDVAVSNVANNEGTKGQLNATPGNGGDDKGLASEGTGTVDNGVAEIYTVQVMPEPVGGMEAWNKFLQKTLRYPSVAQENGISGKTFLSFIIEKDGTITDIQVVRKAGNGFDEESTRVLRLAKPWKPGIQNGKAVRVRYTLPINFQIEAN
ncbi:TonB family protein [Mucilaginibacter myungsuensis]|uniref:TonB family protein n=1 Tax=Mucilaginibacter myungsuensis TaxID=649104 RepID=A0A929KUY0_9SPHI|nr:TonB family protein [Mucilaginibacter myungsuensis]MBE9660368.1 TonB family protein [Mucilaginibacter myungsuensis]MDN3600410.1 TonB family protein [Mucilaginibacter myungsuensis]